MSGSWKTVGLLALAAMALALRFWTVALLTTDHAGPLAYEHGRIAENLLAGRGFSIEFLGRQGPTSQQAPLYPMLLAAVWWLLDGPTPEAVLAVQWLQAAAGTALVLTVVWLGWSLLPRWPSIGWLAGVAAAVFPTHLYMVTHLQVAIWAALGLTVLLAVVVSPRWAGTTTGSLLAGLLAGILLLIDPILSLALPICAVAFFWVSERGDGGLRRLRWPAVGRVALMAAVAALVITPWMLRNWRVHGQPVFIKSTFGYAFWQGNNPLSWGTDKIPKPSAEILRQQHDGSLAAMDRALWEARHETLYIDDLLLKPGGYREFAGLSEPQRSALLRRRAWRFIRENPARYAQLCLNRLRYFLLFDQTNPKAANRLYRLTTVTWLVLGAIGLAVSAGQWRRLWPTYAIFVAVTAFHTLVITSVRFRIPLEPMTLVWVAAAVAPPLARLCGVRPIRIYRPGEHPSDPLPPLDDTVDEAQGDLPVRRRAG